MGEHHHAIVLAGAIAVSLGGACSTSDSPPTPRPPAADAGPNLDDWDRAVVRPDETAANAARAACKFARGALPGETLGATTPVDKDIPIETVVILMQENRSFDTHLGHLYKYVGRTDIESARDDTTNPEKLGMPNSPTYKYQHAPHLCVLDTNHEWPGTHTEYDDGKMDGFFQANDGWAAPAPPQAPSSVLSGERALWWLDERDISFYYDLAATFAIGDHHFSSILGPTWPNRMYLYAATSFGVIDANFPDMSGYPYPKKDATIFDMLEKRGVSWAIYGDGLPGATVAVGPLINSRWGRNPLKRIVDLYDDAAAGKLPQVVFVDPVLGHMRPGQDDEHPPADVQVGQKFVSDVVHAMFKSPQWSKLAMFITYDEHGGFYDHVAPPSACAPDRMAPILPSGDTTVGGFDRYGIRVPLIVVSPFTKKKFVSHVTRDHTSITRFLEAKFRLPALTARDANADAMLEYFDFDAPPFATPPPIVVPTINLTELDYCTKTFTP